MKTILRIALVDGKPSEFTVAPVEAADDATTSIVPEFIRLPKPGFREPFTGLSRSKSNQLILPTKDNGYKPPVRSVVLRKRGAVRGVRLIFLDSLIAYIREQAISSSPRIVRLRPPALKRLCSNVLRERSTTFLKPTTINKK